jgi:hypothetical protein
MPKKIPPSALHAMLLMQSKIVTERVASEKGGLLGMLLEKTPEDARLVEQIYLHTLSRKPNQAELRVGVEALQAERRRGAGNLQWALLNSPEFLFNY